MRPILFTLVMSLLGPWPAARALGVPKICRVRSPELKVARECYTGDMHGPEEGTAFIGLDETSPVDLNYCFNALVAPYPAQGASLSLMVLKDDDKGQAVARTYSVSIAALAASLGRVPTNHKAQVLALGGLKAACYGKRAATDKCSKGFFGYGGTDLPFAVTLENAMTGYVVKGGVRDRAIIDLPGVPTVASRGVSPPAQTLDWLSGQVKQRILSRARRDLASLNARNDAAARASLTAGAGQFQFCRLAYDELHRKLRRPAPFDATETKLLDDLDQGLRGGVGPAAAPSTTVTVPMVSTPARAGGPAPASVTNARPAAQPTAKPGPRTPASAANDGAED